MNINTVLVILGVILAVVILYRLGVLREMFMWVFKLATGSIVGLVLIIVIGVLAFVVIHPYISGAAGFSISSIFG